MAASRLITGFGIFVALTTSALANMPPKEFDHAFPGHIEKFLVRYGEAWAKCNEISIARGEGPYPRSSMRIGDRALYGCAFVDDETFCVIVYSYDPSGKDPLMKSNTFRHERGHCNGWPANHPNSLP